MNSSRTGVSLDRYARTLSLDGLSSHAAGGSWLGWLGVGILICGWLVESPLHAQVSSPQTADLVVRRMVFDVRGGQLPTAVRSGLNYLYGRPFAGNSSQQVRQLIRDILQTEGYYRSQVKLETVEGDGGRGITLRIEIDLGAVCQIAAVEAEFLVADEIAYPQGQICSRRIINDYFAELSFQYKKDGYLESGFESATYQVSADGTRGVIKLAGHIGPKVSYQFQVRGYPEYGLAAREYSSWEKRLVKQVKVVEVSPQAVAEFVVDLLLQAGHRAQVAEPEISVTPQTKIYQYVVMVSEKIELRHVKVLGVKLFDDQQLFSFLRPKNRLGVRKSLSITSLDSRIQALTAAYFRRGYLDMTATTAPLKKRPQMDGYQAVITVREGVPYVFDSLHFTGGSLPDDRLMALANFEVGEPVDETKINVFRAQLNGFFDEQGYLDKKLVFTFERQLVKNRYHTQIHIQVDEGQLHIVDSIKILGLAKTHRQVVLGQLEIAPGAAYTPQRVAASYNKLKQLGLFKSIRFQYQETTSSQAASSAEKRLHVSVQLEELSHGLITFGPAYNLAVGYKYTISGSYNNLFGRAHRIFAQFGVDEDRYQPIIDNRTIFASNMSLRYIYPFVAGWPLDFSLTANRQVSAPSFWQYTWLLREEFGYRLPMLANTTLNLYVKQSLAREQGTRDQRIFFLSNQDSLIFAGGVDFVMDRRNDPELPTAGYRYKLGYEKAIYFYLFNTRYDKFDVRGEVVKGLSQNLAFIVASRFTQLRNIDIRGMSPGFNTLPAGELLQAGGVDMVRGFDRLLGPYLMYNTTLAASSKEVRDILGGTDRWIFNAQLRFAWSQQLSTSLFYDLGNTFLNRETIDAYKVRFAQAESAAISQPEIYDNYPIVISDDLVNVYQLWQKLYSSMGIVADYRTPIGNIQLSVAHPLAQPSYGGCGAVRKFGCLDRRHPARRFFGRVIFNLSIGARF